MLPRLAIIGLAALVICWPPPAHAQDFTCRKDDASRRLYVVIENAAKGLPCEVMMQSPPAEPQRLWRAEFERGFCAERMRDAVERLTDNQWLCRPTVPENTESRQERWRPVM